MYDLKDIQLFSKLSAHSLNELKENAIIRNFKPQSIVFYEGDKGKYLYAILEGMVKLYKTSPKGSQIQINRFEAPAVVGEYACFEQMPFPATCEFLTEGKVAMIPFEFIYKHLSNPDFSLEIIKSLTSKIMVLSSLIHKEIILSSEAKVAKMLLDNIEIFTKLKYNEVAAILNLTPETLSRIFKKFKSQKIIEVDKDHKITILNPMALEMTIETNKLKVCTNCIDRIKMIK
ncbi:MAG: Crp/Fnr family transcriptional regulator [Epsilonproteobacteria bacterium]|nr:Crp/Fnr family transcriptional regulator [Campylobacterota bacterium]